MIIYCQDLIDHGNPKATISIKWQWQGSHGATECELWRMSAEIEKLHAGGYDIISISRA